MLRKIFNFFLKIQTLFNMFCYWALSINKIIFARSGTSSCCEIVIRKFFHTMGFWPCHILGAWHGNIYLCYKILPYIYVCANKPPKPDHQHFPRKVEMESQRCSQLIAMYLFIDLLGLQWGHHIMLWWRRKNNRYAERESL